MNSSRMNVMTALTSVLILVGLVPILMPAYASTRVPPAQWTNEYINGVLPPRISESDLELTKEIALADSNVLQMISSKPIEFTSTDYITDDIGRKPVKWIPEVHFNINNETHLTVAVDLTTKSVVRTLSVESDPRLDRNLDPGQLQTDGSVGIESSASKHSWAVDQITGTSPAPKEIEARFPAMTFTNQIGQTVGNVLLLNAQRSNPTSGTACDPAHVPDRYWAQIGFYWKTSGKLNYDDTSHGCAPQFPALTYTAGSTYKFSITGRTTGGWQLTGINLNTGVSFTYTGPTSVTVDTFRINNMRTSVFFENKLTDTNWASQYSTNPTAHTAKWSPDRVVFYNWPSNVRDDIDCNNIHHVYPYSSTTEVISGQLTSGSTATFRLTRMQSFYPGCN